MLNTGREKNTNLYIDLYSYFMTTSEILLYDFAWNRNRHLIVLVCQRLKTLTIVYALFASLKLKVLQENKIKGLLYILNSLHLLLIH